jgi:hypothetical protein
MENTTYTIYCGNNQTNITLPALRLTWDYGSLQGYDYQEPAIRYGIRSREQFNRSVSCANYPINNTVVMNCTGGTVYTNIGIHPVPFNEYLTHGVVNIPVAAGGELSRVEWKDIWERDHYFNLRTQFYDVITSAVGGPGGGGGGGLWIDGHAVVSTTFEMIVDGNRTKEYPVDEEAMIHYYVVTWNGHREWNGSHYAYSREPPACTSSRRWPAATRSPWTSTRT